MRIAMFTNTYTPHIGGVAGSVQQFTLGCRAHGHRVLVVAPAFEGMPEDEVDVVRMPAIQKFNGSDFSVTLPAPRTVLEALNSFKPEVLHSHHPFLLGDTALRMGSTLDLPLVFTHHTMYEHYTHYVPGELPAFAQFIKTLSVGYANLCDHVIAPSKSVRDILRKRKVETPVTVIPTGVELDKFRRVTGRRFRVRQGIPERAFVVGHLGRLAPEKNLDFLTRAVCRFLRQHPDAHFLVVGNGPSVEPMKALCVLARVLDRVHFTGNLVIPELAESYAAMDVFAFASKSETQGMVLTEAMATGVPVVALDAPGARDVVRDGANGRLLPRESLGDFVRALDWVYDASPEKRRALTRTARRTARTFSSERSVEQVLELYAMLIDRGRTAPDPEKSPRPALLRAISAEWKLWSNRFSAAVSMLGPREIAADGGDRKE